MHATTIARFHTERSRRPLGSLRPVNQMHRPGGHVCREDHGNGCPGRRGTGSRWDDIGIEAARVDDPGVEDEDRAECCVPLSTVALGVLNRARALSSESSLVFPSRTTGRCRGTRRCTRFAAPGSRARSWPAETGVPAEVVQAWPAHAPRSRSGLSAIRPAGVAPPRLSGLGATPAHSECIHLRSVPSSTAPPHVAREMRGPLVRRSAPGTSALAGP